MSKRCNGQHVHQQLVDGRAKEAAEYPEELCRAICTGLIKELNSEGEVHQIRSLMKVQHDTKVDEKEPRERGVKHEEDDQEMLVQAWDDITGEELDAKEVKKARLKEVGYIHEKKVWRKISRREAQQRGIKIVEVRWIDVNKGDTQNPVFRSRLVAK